MQVALTTLESAVRLVDDLAGLDEPARFAELALPGLARLIGCDLVTYNEISDTHVRYVDFPAGALVPATRTIFAAHVHEHPLVNHYRATGDGRPMKISDFLTAREFHRIGLYGEFFRLVSVEYQLALTLSPAGGPLIGVAFNRANRDFTEVERATLGIIRQPILRAMRRAESRQRARAALTCDRVELTDREAMVLKLVARGRTNVAIAHQLDVSPRTIAKHLEHAYRKLGVTSRAAAVGQLTQPE